MVGSRFCELSQLPLVKAVLNSEISVDITKSKSVAKFFEEYEFESVVLFSAYTDVDAAEKQRDYKSGSCWKINVVGASNVAKACSRFKKKLIFMSSDFVFDGTNGPYSEEDKTGPDLEKVSWYGITKIEGERIVSGILDNFVIIRISYPFRARFEGKADFAKQMLKKYDQKDLYPLYADQQITPTFVDDVASCINLLISKNANGIYHLASSIPTSPYEFAKELITIFNRDSKIIKKGNLKYLLEKSAVTPRPLKGGMKTNKIENLGFIPTDWKQGLKEIFDQSEGQLI